MSKLVRIPQLLTLLAFSIATAACVGPQRLSVEAGLPSYAATETIRQTDQSRADDKIFIRKSLPEATNLIVLVHGWMGDGETTWGRLPALLAGAVGDTGRLEWTRKFNVLVYGYRTALNGRELVSQSEILASEIQLAQTRCRCQRVHLVGHSMGGVLVTRAVASLELKERRSPEEQLLIDSLSSITLIAPAYGLAPMPSVIGASLPSRQLAGLDDVGEFHYRLRKDLEVLKEKQPEEYNRVWEKRTTFIIAEDDQIVNNDLPHRLFASSRLLHLPGDHSSIVKINSLDNETLLALEQILERTLSPNMQEQPREIRVEGVSIPNTIVLDENTISVRIDIPTNKQLEAYVTPNDFGFCATAFSEHHLLETIKSVRIVREPTKIPTDNNHMLIIKVDGKPMATIPITAKGVNWSVYQKVVERHQPNLAGGTFPTVDGWGRNRQPTHVLAAAILNSDLWEQITDVHHLTEAFLEFAAGGRTLIPLSVISYGRFERPSPMIMKWFGIAAVGRGDLETGLGHFSRLATVSDIGPRYAALTLVLLNRIEQAKKLVASRGDITQEERADAEVLFGKKAVVALFD
jgi:pimeloyl-ACP methyl ester carboxylesterase